MTWTNDHLAADWFRRPLPANLQLSRNVYIWSSYVFAAFHSEMQPGLVMEEGSGAYDLSLLATGPEARISVGAYTCLKGASLIAEQSIVIGAHCLISWGAVITDALVPCSCDLDRRRGALLETASDPQRRLRALADTRPVNVADNVWIGFDSVLCGGVSIGRGAVVGCKTLITEDVPPYAIVVGNPCRIVRFLEPDDHEEARIAALREFGIEQNFSPVGLA
jgi:carbonic anhydrase/acetyltransferase-like protein (isoleucine patch superfamily)